jgi:TFIIF-interacting CTD phosphatase-like protein
MALLLSVKLCSYLIFPLDFILFALATLQEAERLEQENAARLLETRRLSLIVDLDQTIIHAACDPTVGEWMNDKNNKNHPATKVSWLLRNMCMQSYLSSI